MIGIGLANRNELPIEHLQVIAFYEPETRHIRHLHTVTTIRGAKRVWKEQALAGAKQHAVRHHNNVASLAVAFSSEPKHAHIPHRIDLKTKTL
jgi:hypothetical protein